MALLAAILGTAAAPVLSAAAPASSVVARAFSAMAPVSSAVASGRTADLSVSAALDPAGVVAGSTATAVITARNAGPDRASAVRITVVAPAGVTGVTATSPDGPCTATGVTAICTAASLKPGSTALATITADVPAAAPPGAQASLTASVASVTREADPADNVTSVSAALAARADLSVTLTGDGTATVTNAGPSVARGILLTSVPGGAGRAVPDLDPGGVTTVAPGTLPRPTAVAVSAGTPDPAPAGNIAALRPAGTAVADLSVSLLLSATSGYAVPYAVTVTNHGPSAVTGASVSTAGPAGVTVVRHSTLPVVPAGASVVLPGHAVLGPDAVAGPGWFSVLVISPAADPDPANDTDTVPFLVLPRPS